MNDRQAVGDGIIARLVKDRLPEAATITISRTEFLANNDACLRELVRRRMIESQRNG